MTNQRMVWGLAAAVVLAFGHSAMAQNGTAAPAANNDSEVPATRNKINANAETSLQELFKQNASAKKLYDQAAGFAVFQGTAAGLVVSGAGGLGVAVDKKTGHRTYMKMGSAGVGLSIGARRFDLIIFFETPTHFANFVKGGWDSSATAAATAGTESTGVGSSFFDGVAVFRITSRGLMANADVSGTRFWVAEKLN